MRRLERREDRDGSQEEKVAREMLHLYESLELLFEAGVVVLIGILCASYPLPWHMVWFPVLLFVLVRPLAVWISLLWSDLTRAETGRIAWFGMRGVGSLYYCVYACNQGLPGGLADWLLQLTLLVIVTSIATHGISAVFLARRSAG